MSRMREQLLEAHIQFELQQFEAEPLKQWIQDEVRAWDAFLRETNLEDFIPETVAHEGLKRALCERPLPEHLRQHILEIAEHQLRHLPDRREKVEGLLPRQSFEKAVENAIAAEPIKNEIIHTFVHNPIFAHLIAEILYNGIADFLNETGQFTQKIPVASRLFKMGQEIISNAVGGFSENIERTIKDFIKRNTNQTIIKSEQFLTRGLTPEVLTEASQQVWDDLSARVPGNLPDFMPPEDIHAYEDPAYEFWKHFRGTEFFQVGLGQVIGRLYEQHGKAPVSNLLRDEAFDPEIVSEEISKLALPIVEAMRKNGTLESRVRKRLTAFYESPAAREIFDR